MIVTGGSRGIGRSIVKEAASRGASVVFCARQISPEVQRETAALGAKVHAFQADVSQEADVEALFDKTLQLHGRIDAVINNAGINRDNILVHLSAADWDEVIAVNLTGCFLVARRAVLEFLSQGEGGRIVSIGSLSQNGARSQSSYAASKGGLWGLTRTIAKEYGRRGIYANLVVAGFVDTEISKKLPDFAKKYLIDNCPLRRVGRPEEIAAAALFLASERAAFINGEMLHASGGLMDIPL